jgi:hypothetical protein
MATIYISKIAKRFAVKTYNNWKIELYPKVARAGGLQSQGVKGEAVLGYRPPRRNNTGSEVIRLSALF